MSKKIDTVFVLALITLFAATAFMLVLIGAKQYRHVTNTMNENYENRTASSYLTEKIRQHDTAGSISVGSIDNTPVLCLLADEDGHEYITYIYYYEGALLELVVTRDSVFTLSSGQEILPLEDFTPELINDSLLHFRITNTQGNLQNIYLPIHCNTGKEAP